MSKHFKLVLVVILILILSWFVPLIPMINNQQGGIPGCHGFSLKTSRSLIFPDQSNIIPIFRTIEYENSFNIVSWGECWVS